MHFDHATQGAVFSSIFTQDVPWIIYGFCVKHMRSAIEHTQCKLFVVGNLLPLRLELACDHPRGLERNAGRVEAHLQKNYAVFGPS